MESNDELFIRLDSTNQSVHKFNANHFRSCEFGLKQFTKLESITNKLVVKTKPHTEDFLIYFNIRKIGGNDCAQGFKCNVEYPLPKGSMSTHESCVPKKLLCNCEANCDILVENFEYYDSYDVESDSCRHFSMLNQMCRSDMALYRPKNM